MTKIIARFHKTLEENADVLTGIGLLTLAMGIAVNNAIN